MKLVFLDGGSMVTKEKAHEHLADSFDFPAYYGRNLDALWDMLVSESREVEIMLLNEEMLYENLGDYGREIVRVFEEAEKENPCIGYRTAADCERKKQ